jgi:hypothetical protein
MIDNNDFSNYEYRRGVARGNPTADRNCRTVSRSANNS